MPSVFCLALTLNNAAHERALALPIRIAVVSRINHARQYNYWNIGFPHRWALNNMATNNTNSEHLLRGVVSLSQKTGAEILLQLQSWIACWPFPKHCRRARRGHTTRASLCRRRRTTGVVTRRCIASGKEGLPRSGDCAVPLVARNLLD